MDNREQLCRGILCERAICAGLYSSDAVALDVWHGREETGPLARALALGQCVVMRSRRDGVDSVVDVIALPEGRGPFKLP